MIIDVLFHDRLMDVGHGGGQELVFSAVGHCGSIQQLTADCIPSCRN